MKKLISCILALLLLSTAALAVPGDSCVVLGEELTLGETDGIFAALGVERGAAMELTVSKAEAEACFAGAPETAASVGVYVRIRSAGEGLSLSLSNITGAETAVAAALTAAGVTDAEIVAAAPEETGALTRLFASARFTVSMRLHALTLSYLALTPAFGVDGDGRIAAFAKECGLPYRAAAETGDMTAALEAALEAGMPDAAPRNERLAAGRAALTRALCAPGKEENV